MLYAKKLCERFPNRCEKHVHFIALMERIRSLPPEHGGRIPAVALTAYARVEDRLAALSAGYNMHVPKPVEPAELTLVSASLTGRNKKKAPIRPDTAAP